MRTLAAVAYALLLTVSVSVSPALAKSPATKKPKPVIVRVPFPAAKTLSGYLSESNDQCEPIPLSPDETSPGTVGVKMNPKCRFTDWDFEIDLVKATARWSSRGSSGPTGPKISKAKLTPDEVAGIRKALNGAQRCHQKATKTSCSEDAPIPNLILNPNSKAPFEIGSYAECDNTSGFCDQKREDALFAQIKRIIKKKR